MKALLLCMQFNPEWLTNCIAVNWPTMGLYMHHVVFDVAKHQWTKWLLCSKRKLTIWDLSPERNGDLSENVGFKIWDMVERFKSIYWMICDLPMRFDLRFIHYCKRKRFRHTASFLPSCDVPWCPTTKVPRDVSTAWQSHLTYFGSWTTLIGSRLFVVWYLWRLRGGDVTSKCCDVSDSVLTLNPCVDDRVVSHFTYFEWSSADTRQIWQVLQSQSATYSWRSWRQATMSPGSFIPSTWISSPSGLSVSAVYILMVEDPAETTYAILSSCVTPVITPTTYYTYTIKCYSISHLVVMSRYTDKWPECRSLTPKYRR